MYLLKCSAFLLTLIVLTGCGAQNKSASFINPNPQDQQASEDYFLEPSQNREQRINSNVPRKDGVVTPAMLAARDGNIYCTGPDCNPAVVMISSAAGNTVSRCSGVLIGEDYVLTNDHCLNKSDAVLGELSCDQRIYVHLIGVNGNAQKSISCKKIVYQSQERGLFSKDYAIIQLKEKVRDRAPLELSIRGFNFREAAKMIKIHPYNGPNGSVDGIQQSINCYAAYMTMLYPAIRDSASSLMTFGNCPVEKGNSGSPILNSEGKLAALAQGYLNTTPSSTEFAQYRELGISPIQGTITLATQIRCMTFISPTTAAECQPISPATVLLPKDYLNEYSDAFANTISFPSAIQKSKWKKLSGYSSMAMNVVEAPNCLSLQEARSGSNKNMRVAFYRATINQNYEAEWRPLVFTGGVTTVTAPFMIQSIYSGEARLSSGEYGDVVLPVCGS